MPAPFTNLYYDRDALRYISSGGNPPSRSDRICLTKLANDICSGLKTIHPNPILKRHYLPKVACNHAVYMREDKYNNLIILDIVPYTSPI